MSVPRNEVLWDGGSTLKLIDHVFEISVAKRNKYKEIFESLITTFQNDIDKVTIMQDCAAKADEIKEAFTERRSQAKRQTASTASLLEVVKSCRKQKLEIMEKSQGDLEAEFVLLETDAPNRPTGPMVLKTPAKYSMSEAYETRKRIMTRQEKESTMNEFRRVLFAADDVSGLEIAEAELIMTATQEDAKKENIRKFGDVSFQKEILALQSLFEVAFRALICEHEKKMTLFRSDNGTGEIMWDISVKAETTNNSVLRAAETTFTSAATQGRHTHGLNPRELLNCFKKEHTKYTWFVGMFTPQWEISARVRSFEHSLGQAIKTRLLESSDPTERMYTTLLSLSEEVKSEKVTPFAFFRARFEEQAVGTEGLKTPKPPVVRMVIQENKGFTDKAEIETVVNSAVEALVLKLGPISKSPNGEAKEEVQEEIRQKILKTVWKMKEQTDKPKAKKPAAESDDSGAEEVSTPKPKKRKGPPEDPMKEVVRLLKEQSGKIKEQGGKIQKLMSEGKPIPKGKRVCFAFQKGKCKNGDKCSFEHSGAQGGNGVKKNNSKLPDPPADACANLRAGGTCEDLGCREKHGKWDKNSDRACRREEAGEICKFLFIERGCDFNHKKIKNG